MYLLDAYNHTVDRPVNKQSSNPAIRRPIARLGAFVFRVHRIFNQVAGRSRTRSHEVPGQARPRNFNRACHTVRLCYIQATASRWRDWTSVDFCTANCGHARLHGWQHAGLLDCSIQACLPIHVVPDCACPPDWRAWRITPFAWHVRLLDCLIGSCHHTCWELPLVPLFGLLCSVLNCLVCFGLHCLWVGLP